MRQRTEQRFRDSIRKAFFAYALVPILTIALVTFLVSYAFLHRSMLQRNSAVNQEISVHLESDILAYRGKVDELAGDPQILSLFTGTPANVALYEELYGFVNNQPMRCDFYFLDLRMNIVAASNVNKPVYITETGGIIKRIQESPSLFRFAWEQDTRRSGRYLLLGRAVLQDDEIIGYILFEASPDALQERIGTPAPISVVIADSHRYALWYNNAALVDGLGRLSAPMTDGTMKWNRTVYYVQSTSILDGGMIIYTASDVSEYDSTFRAVGVTLIGVFGGMVLLIGWVSGVLARRKTGAIDTIVQTMQGVDQINIRKRLSITTGDELEQIAQAYNALCDRVERLLRDNEESLRLQMLSEVRQLQSQFNPHFLFNTLDAVKYLIRMNAADAEQAVAHLAKLLRYSIDGRMALVSLKQDIRYIGSYLAIQKYRFGDQLRYWLDVPNQAMHFMVPKLLLQPLVENAIQHGQNDNGSYDITVSVAVEKGSLQMSVLDHGPGMDEKKIKEITALLEREDCTNTRLGLHNVHRRIRLLYGEEYGLSVASGPGQGTRVDIRLPAIMEDEADV